MAEATLLAHADTIRVSERIVRSEPRPEFTDSWHPYSHAEILDVMKGACQKRRIEIVRKEYSIRKNSKMFGVWEVNIGHADFNFAIGIRNSIDKTHSVGLCAGERVFVCDNLVFSGEFVLFRKHTSRLDDSELEMIADEALESVYFKFEELIDWHESLRKIHLSREQAALLIVAALKKEVIPPSKYPQFHDLYFGEDRKYTDTLHGFHGAATELMRDNNLLTIQRKNDFLFRFLKYEAPLLIYSEKPGAGLDHLFHEGLVKGKASFESISKIADLRYLQDRKKEKEGTRKRSQELRKKAETQRREKRRQEREDPERVYKAWKAGKKRLPKHVLKRLYVIGKAQKKALDEGHLLSLPCGTKIRAEKSKGFYLDNSHEPYHSSILLDDCSRRAAIKLKSASKIVKCPYCKSIISTDLKSCPSCGEGLL